MDRILIADSSPIILELLSECLTARGYDILTAETGRQAVDKSLLFLPDITILDVEFSDMSGFDVCKRLKSNPETRYILVLFMCGLETRDSRIRALESGADDIIEKNFDVDILLVKVASLLRIKHLSHQLRDQYKENQEKTRILDYQLKMGRQVQRAMIRDVDISIGGIRFVTKYQPAYDIGGDFYSIIPLTEKLTGVYIGDVSGHGISAALLVSMLNMMIKNTSARYKNPDQFLFHMNNQFCDIFENSGQEIYACMFCVLFDMEKNLIHYSNAGQVPPIFMCAADDKAFELNSAGLPIGIMRDSTYEYGTRVYMPGDLLFFYTDGLSDIYYKDNPDEFVSRLSEILLEEKSADNIYDIIDMVESIFYNFNTSDTEKLNLDDVSVVLCKM